MNTHECPYVHTCTDTYRDTRLFSDIPATWCHGHSYAYTYQAPPSPSPTLAPAAPPLLAWAHADGHTHTPDPRTPVPVPSRRSEAAARKPCEPRTPDSPPRLWGRAREGAGPTTGRGGLTTKSSSPRRSHSALGPCSGPLSSTHPPLSGPTEVGRTADSGHMTLGRANHESPSCSRVTGTGWACGLMVGPRTLAVVTGRRSFLGVQSQGCVWHCKALHVE